MENEARQNDPHRARVTADAGERKLQNTNTALQKISGCQVNRYQRQRDLPCLLPLWPHEIRDETEAGAHVIIAKLRCALRAERQRGRTGHWSYNLDRHLGLLQAYKSEVARLEARIRKCET